MLAKFINDHQIKRQNKRTIVYRENTQIINPKDEDFILDGYKELIIEEEPNYNEETHYLQPYYLEEENKILQKWKVQQIEEDK